MLNPFTHRKILKKGLPGRATIVEMGALDRGATSFNLPMTLQVHVEGIPPYEVEGQWMVKAKDAIGLSAGSIPVRVHPEDHDKVAIDWEGVRAGYEQSKTARREALASGEALTDPAVMDQIAQALGQVGDPLADLERLAALRDRGVLTEEEFQQQKRRVLGG